jgi:hypothetical protein
MGHGLPTVPPSRTGGLPRSVETYGPRTGRVRRPCQNRESPLSSWRGSGKPGEKQICPSPEDGSGETQPQTEATQIHRLSGMFLSGGFHQSHPYFGQVNLGQVSAAQVERNTDKARPPTHTRNQGKNTKDVAGTRQPPQEITAMWCSVFQRMWPNRLRAVSPKCFCCGREKRLVRKAQPHAE